jgi:hypothetical protein
VTALLAVAGVAVSVRAPAAPARLRAEAQLPTGAIAGQLPTDPTIAARQHPAARHLPGASTTVPVPATIALAPPKRAVPREKIPPAGPAPAVALSPLAIAALEPAVGAYVGGGRVADLARFGSATGTTPTVAFDYVSASSWSSIAAPSWLLDQWAPWLQANPTRQLVLSVPMLAEGYAGRFGDTSHDGAFRELATAIAARRVAGQVIIRLGWEMNGDWFPWGGNASGFTNMWRRLIPIFRSVNGQFRFDWSPNGFTAATDWYPGDDVVDLVGMDLYDVTWHAPGGDPSVRWSKLSPNLSAQAAFAGAHHKQVTLDEWALWTASDTVQGGGGDDPTYVTNMLRWVTEHGYLYHAYFDLPSGGVGTVLTENPRSLAAYRAGT